MANFNEAYLIGRNNEGGYSLDKDDRGGETYAGIARNYWPQWEGWKIIDAIKKIGSIKKGQIIHDTQLEAMLESFYKKNFWDRIHGDEINSQQVANIFYDWTLTSGKAIKRVQNIIGVSTDGKFGPNSLKEMNEYISIKGQQELFEKIKNSRREYYLSIGIGNNSKFLKGWINRVDSFNYKNK